MAEIDGTMDKNLRSRKSPCTAGNMANVEGDVLNAWEKRNRELFRELTTNS